MLKDYYQLTKPGIIYGNAVTVIAGFLLATGNHAINWHLFVETLVGISLIMASGCVFNNYIDRDIDGKMERTKSRALVRGTISPRGALAYGTALGSIGILVLFFYTNFLTTLVALGGLFAYVVLYSLWFKRTSTYGTLVGSISGAVPPVVGYLSVSNHVTIGVVILFFILAIWQMPHSFAIAIYRLEDYRRAGIAVLPVKRGIFITKIQMLIYIALFMLATFALAVFGYVGYVYFFTMLVLGLGWLGFAIKGFSTSNNKRWARAMFIFSIFILLSFCLLVVADVTHLFV